MEKGMNGRSFYRTLQGMSLTRREAEIYREVVAGGYQRPRWLTAKLSLGGHTIEFGVTAQPLMIGDEDPVVVNVSARLAQDICDALKWAPTTTRIADALWLSAAARLKPHTQPSDPADRLAAGHSPSMSDIGATLEHSDLVVPTLVDTGISANAGKHWVVTGRKVHQRVANYGWHAVGARFQAQTPDMGVGVLQPLAWRHTGAHTDYSQVLYGVAAVALLDGKPTQLADVAAHPEMWRMVLSDGPTDDFSLFPTKPSTVVRAVVPAQVSRTLRRGATGEDVRALQSVLGLSADGIFGPNTERAVKDFQAAHALDVDGVVGPATRAALAVPAPPSQPTLPVAPSEVQWKQRVSLDSLAFVPAVHYTPVSKDTPRTINRIVIHSMESWEKPTTAESVSGWFGGKAGKAPQASAHFCVDNDSAVLCVRLKDVAWHAPGANKDGIGFELAGFAKQTEAEWRDDYSESMLYIVAQLVAECCKLYNVPVEFIDREGLKRGERGITTHKEVTYAFRKSNHVDPGKGFPMEWFLGLVRAALAEL
jgi:hypothetical protein